jgi:hypothetical protein
LTTTGKRPQTSKAFAESEDLRSVRGEPLSHALRHDFVEWKLLALEGIL